MHAKELAERVEKLKCLVYLLGSLETSWGNKTNTEIGGVLKNYQLTQ